MSPSGTRILMLIDDEPAQQRLVSAMAARAGWRTVIAGDLETALATLGTHDGIMLDAILIDHAMPDSDAAQSIIAIRERRPALPIVFLTAIGTMSIAIDAMRAGATDFVVKPIAPHRLLSALDAVVGNDVMSGELRPLTEKISAPLGFDAIVGSAPQFRAALAIAAKAARSRVPVLIEGESGVGKHVLAEAIHAASPREKRPFLTLNCATISPNLIESELFGHEKGAFTGAFTRHVGKFQEGDSGTLFLDEVGELPADAQLKLLRLIETGEVHPIGARGFREVDVRIITATTSALLSQVAAGRFREDLYYRLALVKVKIPPLRDRADDVAALARHLLARISRQPGLRALGITDEALALLGAYDWPGNVRQLQTALFRAAVQCDGDALTPLDFPDTATASKPRQAHVAAHEAGVTLFQSDGHLRPLDKIEADVIRLAIGHYRGRMTEVARRLGIGRSTLYRKLTELGLDDAA